MRQNRATVSSHSASSSESSPENLLQISVRSFIPGCENRYVRMQPKAWFTQKALAEKLKARYFFNYALQGGKGKLLRFEQMRSHRTSMRMFNVTTKHGFVFRLRKTLIHGRLILY